MPKIVTPEEYLARAQRAHDSRYTYDISTLSSSNGLATITCLIHGAFQQKLANHLLGAGCPQCAGRGVNWVARFRSVHGDRYDYSRVQYKDYKQPVEITCPEHGAFFQTPDNHYRGKQGCPKCKGARIRAAKQLSVEEFIRRATVVHEGKYLYERTQFTNMLSGVVTVLCPQHGAFTQSPVNHLAGKVGCLRCNHMKSRGEEAVAAYMGLFCGVKRRDKSSIPPKELDIFVPEHNLAVEYCGDYWHSLDTAEKVKTQKEAHYKKYLACKNLGIRLLTIYESEWAQRNYAIRRLLRNALGRSRGKLMARKCTLGKPTIAQARAFYARYHPQGGDGSGEHYGLFWKGKLVACMRFSFGINDRGEKKSRVWTLSRYATRITVAGAASRLFKAFVEEFNPQEVKSFSDNRYFEGGMYQQLGFALEAELPPDYQVWSPKFGLRPKTLYQRRNIPARLAEHGVGEVFDPEIDPRSESEMTFLMGCRRLYDCGKKRWVWRPV